MPKPDSKPVIAVDFDEVIFPLAPTFLKYYNEKTKTSLTIDDMTSYYIEEITGEPKETLLAKLEAYVDSGHHSSARPLKGAVDAITRLRERYSLIVVTARAPFFGGNTKKFLDEHFGGLYDGLYNIHSNDVEHKHLSKAQMCKDLSAIALIDDHLNYTLDAAKHGINCLLFGDYAWNRTDNLPSNVTRVKDWQEVLEYFDGR